VAGCGRPEAESAVSQLEMAQRVNVAIRIVFHWGATRPSAIPFKTDKIIQK
jgi:hypothetical protein